MKILLIIAILVIIFLVYLLYQFYKEILDYKRFTCELNDLISDKNKLLKHIAYKCERLSENQYYGNPGIGFRAIKELAESKSPYYEIKKNRTNRRPKQ